MSACASSIKRIVGAGEDLISFMTDFRRFSNSPLTPAPACRSPMSSPRSVTSFKSCGTSPSAMRRARPSTTAVLPTPASPTMIGLFLRRLARMSIICRISRSRPKIGSIPPCLALAVKSVQNRLMALVSAGGGISCPDTSPREACSMEDRQTVVYCTCRASRLTVLSILIY